LGCYIDDEQNLALVFLQGNIIPTDVLNNEIIDTLNSSHGEEESSGS